MNRLNHHLNTFLSFSKSVFCILHACISAENSSFANRLQQCILIATMHDVHWKKIQDKGQGAPCREKPLEKSGLEPAAPNRLADRKHCALSTHPNPHLQKKMVHWWILGAGFPIDTGPETTEDVDMDIRRKHQSDCEHVNVIRTSRVLSPDRTWPDRWLSEMHESRKVGLGTTVEYTERKFKTKA